MKVAVLQMVSTPDVAENLRAAQQLVAQASSEGAELLVLARYVRRGGLDISPWRATPGMAPPSPLRLARQ